MSAVIDLCHCADPALVAKLNKIEKIRYSPYVNFVPIQVRLKEY